MPNATDPVADPEPPPPHASSSVDELSSAPPSMAPRRNPRLEDPAVAMAELRFGSEEWCCVTVDLQLVNTFV
jgi:hypothetical protein